MSAHGPLAISEAAPVICEICGSEAKGGLDWAVPMRSCPRCGEYRFEFSTSLPKTAGAEQMVRLSGWVREQNDAGVEPNITQEVWRRVSRMSIPGLRERAVRALAVIARECRDPRSWFTKDGFANDPELLGRSYSKDASESLVLFDLLSEERHLDTNSSAFRLSIRGRLAIEARGAANSKSLNGFVAMSFEPDLRDVWTTGFDPAIRAAGFSPMRIDNKEFLGGISDEIIAEIRQSRFVVADYTSQKAGVYFEAGFALGMGLSVIPTCRFDEVARLHFDIRHLNTLVWDDAADLRDKLTKRIVAVIGSGPLPKAEP